MHNPRTTAWIPDKLWWESQQSRLNCRAQGLIRQPPQFTKNLPKSYKPDKKLQRGCTWPACHLRSFKTLSKKQAARHRNSNNDNTSTQLFHKYELLTLSKLVLFRYATLNFHHLYVHTKNEACGFAHAPISSGAGLPPTKNLKYSQLKNGFAPRSHSMFLKNLENYKISEFQIFRDGSW